MLLRKGTETLEQVHCGAVTWWKTGHGAVCKAGPDAQCEALFSWSLTKRAQLGRKEGEAKLFSSHMTP